MSSDVRDGSALGAALVLGVCAILAAVTFGMFFYHARSDRQTIQVTGAATERFSSDVVKWSITLSRQVGTGELPRGYSLLRDDVDRVRDRLGRAGVGEEAVGVQPVNARPSYDNRGNRDGFVVDQRLYVVAEEGGEAVESLALDPGELVAGGTVLESSMLEYFYSEIDSLKHELLARATADARRRAEEIAGGSDLEIEGIVSARAGVFQITEPWSTEVSGFGMHNTSTRDKEITVTVHATFETD